MDMFLLIISKKKKKIIRWWNKYCHVIRRGRLVVPPASHAFLKTSGTRGHAGNRTHHYTLVHSTASVHSPLNQAASRLITLSFPFTCLWGRWLFSCFPPMPFREWLKDRKTISSQNSSGVFFALQIKATNKLIEKPWANCKAVALTHTPSVLNSPSQSTILAATVGFLSPSSRCLLLSNLRLLRGC